MTTSRETRYYDRMPSPLGPLTLVADDAGLCEICYEAEQRPNVNDNWQRAPAKLAAARRQLAEYFSRKRTTFDLPLHPRGTPFQLEVWQELLRIPFGITISYGELARRIDKPKAVRAVGAANGRNPIPIIIPCHRVIGADHSLTGYGGGLWIKRELLGLEGRALHGDLFVEPLAAD